MSDSCAKFGGGPTLAKGDHCNDCIFEMGSNARRANIYRDQRLSMKDLAEAALSGEPLDGKMFFISKSWYGRFILYILNLNFLVSSLHFTV